MSFMVNAGKNFTSWLQSNRKKRLQSASLASSKNTWILNAQLGELKWIGPAHILSLLSHMHANKTHALPHTLTLGINPRLRYQSISRSLGLLM